MGGIHVMVKFSAASALSPLLSDWTTTNADVRWVARAGGGARRGWRVVGCQRLTHPAPGTNRGREMEWRNTCVQMAAMSYD